MQTYVVVCRDLPADKDDVFDRHFGCFTRTFKSSGDAITEAESMKNVQKPEVFRVEMILKEVEGPYSWMGSDYGKTSIS